MFSLKVLVYYLSWSHVFITCVGLNKISFHAKENDTHDRLFLFLHGNGLGHVNIHKYNIPISMISTILVSSFWWVVSHYLTLSNLLFTDRT